MAVLFNRTSNWFRVGTLTFTIAVDDNDTNVISCDEFRGASELMICAPAALTGTITLMSASANDSATPALVTVQSPPGTDVTIAAAKGIVLTAFPFPGIALHSSSNEVADRAFPVWGRKAVVVGS